MRGKRARMDAGDGGIGRDGGDGKDGEDGGVGCPARARRRVHWLAIGLAIGLAAVLATPGWATSHAEGEASEAEPVARQSIGQACQDDIARVCDSTEGRAATFRCLEDHEASLMPECRDAVAGRLDRIKRRMDELIAACEADINALCGGDSATLHRGEIFQCLDSQRDLLSETCSGAIGGAHGKHHKHGRHGACGGECTGECKGGSDGECKGECDGECKGECGGKCKGDCGGGRGAGSGGGCGECHAEFERLCPDAADHDALHACVEARQDQISAECRTHFAECQRRQGEAGGQ